jgi:branched-chain amino acid transport system substrate-binding protein
MTNLLDTFGRLTAAALALAGTLAMSPAMAQGKPPLRIGAYLSVTGPAAYLGSGAMKTVEMYVDSINASGGIDGRKLELVRYDDESDPARANTLVKRMLDNDGVHVLIGGSTTGTTMSAVPLVERAGVPMLSLAGGTVIIDPIKKFVFKMNQTDAMAIARLYEHMNKNKIATIGVIAGTDAFGRACLGAAQKLAPEMRMKIAREESFNVKDTDMTAQLTNLRQAPGVQAILNCGFGEPAVILTKNFKQLGITIPHYGTHALASDTFVKLAGPAAEDMVMTNGPILVWDQLPATDPLQGVVQAYVKAYQAKYGEAPSYFAGNAHDAMLAIRQAVQRAGSIEPGKLRDAIEASSFKGVTGPFQMSATDHIGLTAASLRIVQVKGGRWKLVE